jgi:hypothetical protein
LTIGAFNPTTRAGKGDRMFRGLIDDIRVFGSAADGAGALQFEQIRNIQRGQVDTMNGKPTRLIGVVDR